MTLLPLGAAALFGDQVGGDAEEERLGVTDFATGLIGRDADVCLLDDVIDGGDAEATEAGRKPSRVMAIEPIKIVSAEATLRRV